jgi:hypothetical protein
VKRILSTKETSDTGLDQDLWKRPWTSEEMEPLAITMGDFEVSWLLSIFSCMVNLAIF